MENKKTISEIAKEIGVTKKILQNKIYREDKKRVEKMGEVINIDGRETRCFSPKEEQFIKSWYSIQKEEKNEVTSKKDSEQTIFDRDVKDYLETILEEVRELKKEVSRQSIEIEELTSKNRLIELENSEKAQENENIETNEFKTKKNFFSRLFRK